METTKILDLFNELKKIGKSSSSQLGKYGVFNKLNLDEISDMDSPTVTRKVRKMAVAEAIHRWLVHGQLKWIVEFIQNNTRQLGGGEMTTTEILWNRYRVVYQEMERQGKDPNYMDVISNLDNKPAEQEKAPEQPPEPQKDEQLEKAKKRYEQAVELFEGLLDCTKQLYIYGPAGTGKTTIARKYAEKLGLKVYGYCSGCDSYQFKGSDGVDGKYKYALIESWFKDGGMLILDELDNYQASVIVELNDYLNRGTTKITLQNGEELTRHPDTYVVATGNTDGMGGTIAYHSRDRLDASVLSRLGRFKFNEMEYIVRLILGDKYNSIKELHDRRCTSELNIRTAETYKKIVDKMGEKGLKTLIEKYNYTT